MEQEKTRMINGVMYEIQYVDSLGREHIEINETWFTLDKETLFWEWVKEKYKSITEFQKLSFNEKEKILLRWKYGLSDEANRALASSDKQLLFVYRQCDLSRETPERKFHIEQKIGLENRCFKIRQNFADKRTQPTDPIVQHIQETFEGELM